MQLQVLKRESKDVSHGFAIPWRDDLLEKKLSLIPFELTDAQKRSLDDILQDMQAPIHMNRLLQGDVGSGKTVVACLAMYAAYSAGVQSALMVPTEILAEQHFDSLSQLFPELRIVLLTGGMKQAERKEALEAIEAGQVDMIVGTHALIQEGVSYHRLGLVIIDEQHRFGVEQRRILREKGNNPDVLMMTVPSADDSGLLSMRFLKLSGAAASASWALREEMTGASSLPPMLHEPIVSASVVAAVNVVSRRRVEDLRRRRGCVALISGLL